MVAGAIDPTTPVAPSSPDPALTVLVYDALRALFLVASGIAGFWGVHLQDPGVAALTILSSALVALGMAIWSLVEWIKAKRRDHLGSVMSARLGRPVQPA
jgi:hypothetical protein